MTGFGEMKDRQDDVVTAKSKVPALFSVFSLECALFEGILYLASREPRLRFCGCRTTRNSHLE
jgi:hypothetical protein